MKLAESKSLIAKLLATENITIEYKNSKTASSDLSTRTLYLPNLKVDLSTNVLDLFIGHEVSHFLYTPTDEWLDAITKCRKSILNIIEDCRIERKIQYKYPGLKTSFLKGYQELNTLNFFNIKDKDLNKLGFLDRVNIHSKVGASLCIDFSFEETLLLEKINTTVTFQDVVDVSFEVSEFVKKLNDSKPVTNYEEYDYDKEYDKESDDDYEFDDSEELEEEDEDSLSSIDHEVEKEDDNEFIDEEESPTQEAFEKNSDSLISEDYKEKVYVNVNVPSSKEFIIPPTQILNELCSYYDFTSENLPPLTQYNKFIKENANVIQFLANEFNLKKNADQYQKIKVSKTGVLNEKKLFSYKISEDIFRTATNVKSGKSHGIIMFLDWSGSMAKYLQDTIKQVLNVVMFCRKLGIPYEVYAFTSRYIKSEIQPSLIKEDGIFIEPSDVTLLNFFSTNMSTKEFKYMVNILLSFNQILFDGVFDNYSYKSWPNNYSLGITPLNETIVLSMDIIPKFKAYNKLQYVHTMFLTDGEAQSIKYNDYSRGYKNRPSVSKVMFGRDKLVILRNKETKVNKSINQLTTNNYDSISVTRTLFEMLREQIPDNIIGFRIIKTKDFNRGDADYYFNSAGEIEDSKVKFRKHKYVSVKNSMFNKCFLVKDNSLAITAEDYEIDADKMSVKKIANEFLKFSKKKTLDRIFLSEFISMLS